MAAHRIQNPGGYGALEYDRDLARSKPPRQSTKVVFEQIGPESGIFAGAEFWREYFCI
jgi:hypothetical protein